MSSDPFAEAEAMLDESDRMLQRRMEEVDELNRALSSVQVFGANRDGSVKVKVDQTGGLADIKFTDAALRLSPDDLRAEIMRGVTTARQHLAERVTKAVAGVYGDTSATTAMFEEQYKAHFGTPESEKSGKDRHRG